MFLPDRYIKGICPNCGTPDQYGDNCESVRRHLRADRAEGPALGDLRRHPGTARIEHFFFEVGRFDAVPARVAGRRRRHARRQGQAAASGSMPRAACAPGTSRATRPTSASRSPATRASIFYVWLDAPIGYLVAASRRWCDERPASDFDAYLARRATKHRAASISSARTSSTSTACSGRRCCTAPATRAPTRLHVNGYLTVNGAKMSKSRGTFVMARTYLDRRPGTGSPALLLRGQVRRRRRTTSTSNLGDFISARQRRPGRQVRQPRQPLRRLHQQSASMAAWPTPARCRQYDRFVAGLAPDP